MVDYNVALGVRPPEIGNPINSLVAFAKLKDLQSQSQLQDFLLEERRRRVGDLAAYSEAMRSGDPDAPKLLAAHPDAMGQAVSAINAMDAGKRAQLEYNNTVLGREAAGLVPYIDKPEFPQAVQSAVKRIVDDPRIDDRTKQLAVQFGQNPSPLVLQQVLAQTSGLDAYFKQQGTATAQRAAGMMYGGGTNAGTSPQVPTPAPQEPTGIGIQPSVPMGLTETATAARSPNERRLVATESGGRPDVVNRFGFAGLYQFGAPRLADLGVYSPGSNEKLGNWNKTVSTAPGKWSGTFNIPGFQNVRTLDDFLANPEAQQAVYDMHRTRMGQEARVNGLDRYIGQTVGGVEITPAGLENMIHLGGVEGTRRVLESGGRSNPRDANGTSVLDYARMGARAGTAPMAGGAPTAASPATGRDGRPPAAQRAQLAFAMMQNPGLGPEQRKAWEAEHKDALEEIKATRESAGIYGKTTAKEQAEADVKRQAEQPEAKKSLLGAVDGLDRLEAIASKIIADPNLKWAVGIGGVTRVIPGTPGADTDAMIETLKSQVAFGVLQAMREASKTGGALGNVSDAEGRRLESNIAALASKQSPDSFRKNLQEIVAYARAAKKRLNDAYSETYGSLQSAAQPAAPQTGATTTVPPQGPAASPVLAPAAAPVQPAQALTLEIGAVVNGFRYRGGDPNAQSSWERVTAPPVESFEAM